MYRSVSSCYATLGTWNIGFCVRYADKFTFTQLQLRFAFVVVQLQALPHKWRILCRVMPWKVRVLGLLCLMSHSIFEWQNSMSFWYPFQCLSVSCFMFAFIFFLQIRFKLNLLSVDLCHMWVKLVVWKSENACNHRFSVFLHRFPFHFTFTLTRYVIERWGGYMLW